MTKPKNIILTSLLILILIFILNLSKSNLINHIQEEDPLITKELDRAISISKFNIDKGIEELNKLANLPKYTDYKKKYVLARLYEKKKDINKALKIYENIINYNFPLKERIIFHYAKLNTEIENDKKALRYINKLLHDFPTSRSVPQTKYLLAQTQFRLKLNNQAVNTLLSLKSEFPKTQFGIATNYYLGEYAFNKQNYSEALKLWREYLKQSPDGRFATEIGNILETSKEIQLETIDYMFLGDVFFKNKDYKKAAKYYKNCNFKKRYYKLGYSLYRINNKIEAVHFLREFAKNYPDSKNSILALYYGSLCTPSYLRRNWWSSARKEIPDLAYYTVYKEAMTENNPKAKERLLNNYIKEFPNSIFTSDSAWEIMWLKIQSNDLKDAIELGEKYFNVLTNEEISFQESWVKVGFWLGKIAEKLGDTEKAVYFYKKVKDAIFDNYYCFRAKGRYLTLTQNYNNNHWELTKNKNNLKDVFWTIPNVIKLDTLKNHFGTTTLELIKLQQFDEAIELIGKSKYPTKQITAWLKALNNEYEESINLANELATKYKYKSTNTFWKLAYPLYYLHYILENSMDYEEIDPLLVLALIRQESRFETNALSVSNARGLMQLIPQTAKSVARQINTNLSSQDALYDPELNIKLGTKYLNDLLKEFNNPLYSVASYNAGPHAIKRWINNRAIISLWGSYDLDLFVEKIPYAQTKDYVKKVFSNYWTYLNLYPNDTN